MNVIVDYQAGNLANLKNALNYLGLDNQIATDAKSIKDASRILMPGVGAFQPAMESFGNQGWWKPSWSKLMRECLFWEFASGCNFCLRKDGKVADIRDWGS